MRLLWGVEKSKMLAWHVVFQEEDRENYVRSILAKCWRDGCLGAIGENRGYDAKAHRVGGGAGISIELPKKALDPSPQATQKSFAAAFKTVVIGAATFFFGPMAGLNLHGSPGL